MMGNEGGRIMQIKYKKWVLEDDGLGYTLKRYTGKVVTDKNGVERAETDVIKYPGTVEQSIKLIIRHDLLLDHEELELKDYIAQYKEATEKIQKELNF